VTPEQREKIRDRLRDSYQEFDVSVVAMAHMLTDITALLADNERLEWELDDQRECHHNAKADALELRRELEEARDVGAREAITLRERETELEEVMEEMERRRDQSQAAKGEKG